MMPTSPSLWREQNTKHPACLTRQHTRYVEQSSVKPELRRNVSKVAAPTRSFPGAAPQLREGARHHGAATRAQRPVSARRRGGCLAVVATNVLPTAWKCPLSYLGKPSWAQATLAWWPFQSSEHTVLQAASVNTCSTPF